VGTYPWYARQIAGLVAATAALGSGGHMSIPQGGEPGQPRQTGQQTGMPGQHPVPGQSGTAGQGGIPSQAGPPDQEWRSQEDQYRYGVPPQGTGDERWDGPAAGIAGIAGRPVSPVNKHDTRVTGRRAVQYIIDAIIFSIVASVISRALDRGTGGIHGLLVFVTVVVDVLWYLVYWALRPSQHGGQTFGMQALRIRVISADGGPASFVQLAVRSVLLVLFSPLSVLVGWIVMMFSHYRQRTGDHIARTMVVRQRVQPPAARREYAGAGHVRRI
jgi:uncharacterized RDD family membrane protein YckC